MKLSIKKVSRIATYGLLISAIVYTTVILVAIGQGYHFNWRSLSLEAGGLAIVETKPGNSSINLDGKDIGKTTPQRLRLRGGDHSLSISKPGYRTWHKEFMTDTGGVTWLQYPLLVPKTLKTEQVSTSTRLYNFSQSPDKRFLVWSATDGIEQVYALEIGQTKPEVIYEFSKSAASPELEKIEWAPDSKHLLLTTRTGSRREHIILSKDQPQETQSIESLLKIAPDALQFSTHDWQKLHWLNGTNLSEVSVSGEGYVKLLARNVKSFESVKDELFLLQTKGSSTNISRLRGDGSTSLIVDNLKNRNYEAEFLLYGNIRYLAVLDVSAKVVSLYNPDSENQQTVGRFDTVTAEKISKSPDGRYLVMQSGNKFVTYDLEHERLYRFEVPGESSSIPLWHDKYHLLFAGAGYSWIVEFDGENQEKLLKNSINSPIFSSRDGELLFQLDVSKGKQQLVQTSLNIDR